MEEQVAGREPGALCKMVVLAMASAMPRVQPAVRIRQARADPPSVLERESSGVAAVFWQARWFFGRS